MKGRTGPAAGGGGRYPPRGSPRYARSAPRGKKKAAVAVGHSILTIAYHLLRSPAPYQDLGAHYLNGRDRDRVQRRLVGRLETLGYEVTLEPAA